MSSVWASSGWLPASYWARPVRSAVRDLVEVPPPVVDGSDVKGSLEVKRKRLVLPIVTVSVRPKSSSWFIGRSSRFCATDGLLTKGVARSNSGVDGRMSKEKALPEKVGEFAEAPAGTQ